MRQRRAPPSPHEPPAPFLGAPIASKASGGEGTGYVGDTSFSLAMDSGVCDMLNQAADFDYRRSRITDSLLCGLLEGGRDASDARCRRVFGPAAAKKGQQLLERLIYERTTTIKRLGMDEAGGKSFGRFLGNERVSGEYVLAAGEAELLGP